MDLSKLTKKAEKMKLSEESLYLLLTLSGKAEDCESLLRKKLYEFVYDLQKNGLQMKAREMFNLASSTGQGTLANDALVTAVDAGTGGNEISIAYADPGAPSSALSVAVSGKAITVNLGTNGASALISTLQQVTDAVNAHATAKTLVLMELLPGVTTTAVANTAAAQTYLKDGEMKAVLVGNKKHLY